MLDKAFVTLQNYQWGDDRNALNPIDEAVVASRDDKAARAKLEARMIAVLKSNATRNGKDYICRKLKVMGTAASVPTLASMLGDKQHAHMARYALQTMEDPAAGKALLDSLPGLSGDLKIGVIASLGARQENGAVSALAGLLDDADAAVAQAAALALGAIRSKDAAKALASADANARNIDASLACAESLLADGDKLGALAIYKRIAKGQVAKHVKLAATRGMLACAGRA